MRQRQGKRYLTGAFVLAGTSVITGYLLSAKLGTFSITAISMAIALLGLLPFYGARAVRAIRRLTKHDWTMLFFQALFGIFLFRLFLLLGIRLTGTAEAGILTGTTPAITAVLAYIFLKEKPSIVMVIGISATVVGIILLQGNSILNPSVLSRSVLGSALILGAAASESAFNVISRSHGADHSDRSPANIHPMVQTMLVSAIAFCLSAIPALIERPFPALNTLGLQEWMAVVWYGLGITALAFAFFYAGAKRCEAYTIASFSGLIPLTSLLLSVLFLQETLVPIQWCGAALILLSMRFIEHKKRRQTC